MIWFIVLIVILLLISPLLVCIHFTNKWYNKGYNDTIKSYENGTLGKVENPKYVKHSCSENKWWHYGAYNAYCKIHNILKLD